MADAGQSFGIRLTAGWLTLLSALLALGACQSTPEPFRPQPLTDSVNALVYVYWPGQRWREKSGQAPEIQLDGVPVGLLKYKTYIPLEITPGNHEFRATGDSEYSDWKGRDEVVVIPIKADDITYVRLLVKYDQTKNTWQNPGMSHVVQLLPAPEAKALAELAELKEARQKN